MLEIAMNELVRASMDFYKLTGIKIVLYDENRNYLYSYPEEMCSFCETVRTISELSKKCISCDNVGFDVCEKTHKPYIYRCHLGLAEAIAPICENDIVIGYMMLGQILCEQDKEKAIESAVEICNRYNFDRGQMLDMLGRVRVVGEDFIASAVNMMSMCACYLYCNKIIRNKSDVISVLIEKYIDSHLAEDLGLDVLCGKLYISRSRLYSISKSCFNMGISDYVRKKRIEEAKNKLKGTDTPINVIAVEVGYIDVNYFSRIFKKETGYTPSAYRKSVI